MLHYLKETGMAIFSYLPSRIKIWTYRRRGARIGKEVYLSLGSIIYPKNGDFQRIVLEDNCCFEGNVRIMGVERFTCGKDVTIARDTKIIGDAGVDIGDSVFISMDVFMDVWEDIEIGNRAALSPRCQLYTHAKHQSFEKHEPILIGEDAWIGAGAIILPGVSVGEKSIVGAGAIVTKNVAESMVAAGNPAKKIRAL